MTLEDFVRIARRAGFAMDDADLEALYREIGASCQSVRQGTERIRLRLSQQGSAARRVSSDGLSGRVED